MLVEMTGFSFFLMTNMLLYMHTLSSLSIHPLVDTWVVVISFVNNTGMLECGSEDNSSRF